MLHSGGSVAQDLNAKIQVASNHFASLMCVMRSRAIPLPVALRIFEARVDGAISPVRCIDADRWRNACLVGVARASGVQSKRWLVVEQNYGAFLFTTSTGASV